jgi:hypothetical protein
MQRRWVATGHLEHDAWLFRDGRFAQSPTGDLVSFNFDAAAPDTSGRFTVAGNTLTMEWGNGERYEGEAEVEAGTGCFYYNTGSFCPAEPFRTTVLDGSYEGGSGIQTSSGPASGSNSFTFRPDGTYTRETAASIGFGGEEGDTAAMAGSTGGESGRYRVDGMSLVLTSDGGGERALTAFPFGEGIDASQPERIFLDGVLLTRRG